MPIKVTPFENPFRVFIKENGDKERTIIHKGKKYQQVVRNVSK